MLTLLLLEVLKLVLLSLLLLLGVSRLIPVREPFGESSPKRVGRVGGRTREQGR